jgi:hypothetical protein
MEDMSTFKRIEKFLTNRYWDHALITKVLNRETLDLE